MELFSVSPIIIIACGWLESEEMLQMLQPLISTLHADNRCVVTSTVQCSTVQYCTVQHTLNQLIYLTKVYF